MKAVIFIFLAAFSTFAAREPIPEWHAGAEKWCLTFDSRAARIDGPVAVTRISERSIGFEVTRGENAKLYRAFDFSSTDKGEHKPILKAIPYGANGTGRASQQQVLEAARGSYADYAEILNALGL